MKVRFQFNVLECFSKCNNIFKNSLDPKRVFCKKGCLGDGSYNECITETCSKLCVKEEIGSDENKWGGK